MPTLVIVDRSGFERQIDAQPERSVMKNICDAGINELLAVCGGLCSCATCHVYIDAGWAMLPQISESEEKLLSDSEYRRSNSRLSCQITMTDRLDGLRVTIAPQD